MGVYRTICDAIAADLTTNVAGLGQATAHKYVPREPEWLERDGQAHFAVWPELERPETATPLTTLPAGGGGADNLALSMVICYWEPYESVEAGTLPQSEDAAAAYLDLAEATRARLYAMTNQIIAGSYLLRYDRLHFATTGDGLRWFSLAFIVSVPAVYTAT